MRDKRGRIRRAVIMAAMVFLAGNAAHAQEAEVTGLAPSITGSLGCDVGCVDSYLVKCTQASRTMHVQLQDLASQDCFSVTLVGTAPLPMHGAAASREACGATTVVSLVRPTSAEGTMTGLATVHTFSSSAGQRGYKVTATCETGSGLPRSTSLTSRENE